MERKAVIVDLDGTLCDVEHRNHLVKKKPARWNEYFLACHLDPPKENVVEVVRCLTNCHDIHIFSGRGDVARDLTEAWLEKHEIAYESLTMRHEGDRTPDQILKRRWVTEKGFTPENVLCILDDRQKVVNMWREMGFTCLQVAPGDF